MIGFYRDEFGMSPREAVAINGGHTLGAATGASGWEGLWTTS